MSLTSIITVNFNQPQVTFDFLRSVKDNTTGVTLEVILVDNGSREDHEEAYRAIYPSLIYIRSATNLGFAGGNNLGIKVAKGDYLLLLNNDTEITNNLLDTLITEFESNPEIGILSPLILYFDQPELIQYAGFTQMNYLTCRNEGIGNMEINEGQYDLDSRETGYCHGAAMMCRRSDLENVGLMAEQFFLYYEELDWCEKFKKTGKKIWFTGKARIFHKESVSVGKESNIKTYFMTRNRMLFIRRNTGMLNIILFSIYYITFACSKQILVYFLKRRSDLIKWVFKGVWWNFTNSKNSDKLGFKI
ncbi:MAG: glycosyltransferase family 2 protein [Candidatus Pedobacter colombiensis]|uniref:Glycosyltransferase family 2 protein n=1 Tax=Candidatus Pedobacter colombiensis TaxID=3121371 RepID=A0AAJ6BAG0_9SPHI|nr:glycosyltransferase family 2 protein [Pedobacter sp.]WEK21228.1 MAG: glycosyltransferase family 2 protein [Pedobacter sp.]